MLTRTTQQAAVVVYEVAAELSILGGPVGGYIKLKSIGDMSQDIGGWRVVLVVDEIGWSADGTLNVSCIAALTLYYSSG